jgi:NADP-dependent 3-hydroxy acid dehydrogenase YdfG
VTETPDRVALITGASSGIGAVTARRFAEEGTAVVLAARNTEPLEAVTEECREHGVAAVAVPTDVTDPDAVDTLVETAVERFERLDVAVANAGTGETRNVPLSELPREQFAAVTETNVHGAFYTTRAALPHLRERDGALVFVGSSKGKYPSTSTPVYAASKWWVRGFAASVAGRAGPDGVAVTVINPTGVPTAFGSDFRESTNAESLDPKATVGAGDVADAIVYAAGQEGATAVAELDLYRRDIHARF